MKRVGRKHYRLAPSDLTETVVIKDNASVQDIMSVILEVYEETKAQTRNYARNFDFSTRAGFEALWWDIKEKVRYREDEPGIEIVKSPSALYKIGKGDCKSFTVASASTMFNGGVEKSIMRLCHYGNPNSAHIYPIAYLDGKPIIMDSVHHTFDEEAPGMVWYMDYDPETRSVIRQVGQRSQATNQLMDTLVDIGIVIGATRMLTSSNFWIRASGLLVLINRIGKFLNISSRL